ncbi:MAG: carboxymuconolactone decarboxylase family protein [Clostridiales bacterium]|nr:carboxymuconolactone decarboxylase family protein [Clostridiales bacterium]
MPDKPQGRPLFSLAEIYKITYQAIRTAPHMARGEKRGLTTVELRERLMMAVTEVNGCAMCSWYHTRVALSTGMAEDEIRRMLSGELKDVPDGEITAVLFAQHYADTRGKPDRAAWEKLCERYGKPATLAMLGAIRGIMLGNALGIPSGSLLGRLGVKRFPVDRRSSLGYEIAVLLSGAVFIPLALLHAGAAWALRVKVVP